MSIRAERNKHSLQFRRMEAPPPRDTRMSRSPRQRNRRIELALSPARIPRSADNRPVTNLSFTGTNQAVFGCGDK